MNIKVDVVMLTKNSLSRNKPGVFERVLLSIKEKIPINKLIVVDGYSKDGTVDIIKELFGNNAIIIRTSALRGKAREIGIKNVETGIFAFIDDDVILLDDWFANAFKYFRDSRVGLIWGRNIDVCSRTILGRLPVLTPTPFMGNTLIRTAAVKDIEIPADMHIQEDWFIGNYVRRKGYKVVHAKDVYCIHMGPATKPFEIKDIEIVAYVQAKYNSPWGKWTWLHVWREFFIGIPLTMLIYATSKNTNLAKNYFRTKYWKLIYYLKFKLNSKLLIR